MMPKRYTDAEVIEVVDLYNLGYGVRTISRLVTMSESNIEQILEGKIRRAITGGRIMNGRRSKESLKNGN